MQHVIERFPQYMVLYLPYVPGSADLPLADRKLLEAARARDVGVILVPSSGPGTVPGASVRPVETNPLVLAGILSNADISAIAVAVSQPGDVDNAAQASFERQATL
jgi:hypothetical protein